MKDLDVIPISWVQYCHISWMKNISQVIENVLRIIKDDVGQLCIILSSV